MTGEPVDTLRPLVTALKRGQALRLRAGEERKLAMHRNWLLIVALTAATLAACSNNSDGVVEDSRRLPDREVSIVPPTDAPTRAATATDDPNATPTATLTDPPPALTEVADATRVITPTLPPSKTPTNTVEPSVTFTPTFTFTPPPPPTDEPEEQVLLVPTIIYSDEVYVTQVPALDPADSTDSSEVSAPVPGVPREPRQGCSTGIWFFSNPFRADCPLEPARTTDASFQQFEYGYMVWVQAEDAIYVLYDDPQPPRWERYPDDWDERGQPPDPPESNDVQPYSWQPRRGFGLIWRENPQVRQRLGWAIQEWEYSYSMEVQQSHDEFIYMSEPRGALFELIPGGGDWSRYLD